MRSAMIAAAGVLACLALAAGLAGCRIHEENGPNGESKKVQVDTPFGGIHVNTDQLTAADLGLPVYPGAQVVTGDDNHKSADVHMGFGSFEMRIKVVSYSSNDSQEKVVAFYKKALTRFGDVITCQDHVAVGKPVATSEGLTCADDGNNVKVDAGAGSYDPKKGGFQLKAGSKRHEHVVGFESAAPGTSHYSLVELDLPAMVEGKSDSSD